jgi:hypothetical protein
MTTDRRTCVHEAGHSVVASACGWTIGAVTVRPGTVLAGCAAYRPPPVDPEQLRCLDAMRPLVLWPDSLRRRLEADVMVSLAGECAELMLSALTTGRQPERITETVAAALEDMQPTAGEAEWAASIVDDDVAMTDDAEHVLKSAWAAFGPDWRSARYWVDLLAAQTHAIVTAEAHKIMYVADLLGDTGLMSAAAMKAAIEGFA